MSYYNKCPDCGAHLDPGETCDCNTKLMSDEAENIYSNHKGDILGAMNAAFKLGYSKAAKNIEYGRIRKDPSPAATVDRSKRDTLPKNIF